VWLELLTGTGGEPAVSFIGDDWAEAHHDIEIVDEDGVVLAGRRLAEGVAGVASLHALVGNWLGERDEPDQVLVGIETDRGPWVQALIAAGYTVYAINPAQVARSRGRHATAGRSPIPAMRMCWPRSCGWIGLTTVRWPRTPRLPSTSRLPPERTRR
jgi:hypothetical protein